MKRTERPFILRYVVALDASIIALYITVMSPLGGGAPFILLAAAVMLSSWYGGLGPGILAGCITALASLYWIIPPSDSFAIIAPSDGLRFGAFLFTTCLILIITKERERARDSAQAQANRQAIVAELGQSALANGDIPALLDKAVGLLAGLPPSDHSYVLESISENAGLLLKAGRGWKEGLIGKLTVPAGTGSLAGYTLFSKSPLLVKDLRSETRFAVPSFLRDHGIVSGVTVVIGQVDKPFGVLGTFSTQRWSPTREDIHFVQAVANVLAAAIEHERVESARRESETRYRTSIEGMLDAFAVLRAVRDSSNRIVDFVYEYVNAAACRLNHLPREAQIGKRLLEVFPAHKAAGLFDEYCQVVETGVPLVKPSFVYDALFGPPGLARAFDISATKLGDGFVVAWRDVTERKRVEQALAERAALLDLAHDAILVRTLEGNITFWNRGAEDMYGWSKAEAIGQVLHRLLQTLSPEPIDAIRDQVIRFGHWDGELVHRRRDGKTIVVASRWALQRDGEGRPVGILEILSDMTTRKQAERALQESEERYRRIVETAVEGIWSTDSEGKTDYINPRGAQMLGYTPEEMLGRSPLEFTFSEDLDKTSKELERRRQGNGSQSDLRLCCKDGSERWVYMSTTSILDEAGRYRGALSMFSDVTARRRAEARLRDLVQQVILLQEQERRTVSRELNDGIGQSIAAAKLKLESLQSELSQEQAAVQQPIDETVSQMADSIRRLQMLAQDLRPPSLDTAGLDATLEGICNRFNRETGLAVDYTGGISNDLPDAVCVFLYRMLQEALSNVVCHARAKHVRVDLRQGVARKLHDPLVLING